MFIKGFRFKDVSKLPSIHECGAAKKGKRTMPRRERGKKSAATTRGFSLRDSTRPAKVSVLRRVETEGRTVREGVPQLQVETRGSRPRQRMRENINNKQTTPTQSPAPPGSVWSTMRSPQIGPCSKRRKMQFRKKSCEPRRVHFLLFSPKSPIVAEATKNKPHIFGRYETRFNNHTPAYYTALEIGCSVLCYYTMTYIGNHPSPESVTTNPYLSPISCPTKPPHPIKSTGPESKIH